MTDQPSDPNCIFCKIVAGKVPSFKLHEDDRTLAFMDINPLNPGHALVITKGHWPDLYAMPDADLAAAAKAARRVAKAVQAAVEPDGINLLQANGPGAAQSVPHFHIHVLPRRMNDGAKMNWGLQPGDMKAIGALADKIKAKLA
jgi:histidine triad (HIT) family protein